MRHIQLALAVLSAIALLSPVIATEISVNLDNHDIGDYSNSGISGDFSEGSLSYDKVGHIGVSGGGHGGRAIQVRYEKNRRGPFHGGQFEIDFAKKSELWCEYDLYLEPGWVWTQGDKEVHVGGKLPGLAGGASYTGGTGRDARLKGDGFSARYMWRARGELVLYLYYKDMPEDYGESSFTGYHLPIGEWVTLKQQIKMNTDWNANGFVKIWANGKLILDKQNMRFMTTNHGSSKFMFSTFYGGADKTWAPSKDTYAKFDNIKISESDPSSTTDNVQ